MAYRNTLVHKGLPDHVPRQAGKMRSRVNTRKDSLLSFTNVTERHFSVESYGT